VEPPSRVRLARALQGSPVDAGVLAELASGTWT
jgi:hypothetical protein